MPELHKRWKEITSGILTLAQESIPVGGDPVYPGIDNASFLGLDASEIHRAG